MACPHRRLPDEDTCDECAECRVNASGGGDQRHQAGGDQDRGNHRDPADKWVVCPFDKTKNQLSANREADNQKYRCPRILRASSLLKNSAEGANFGNIWQAYRNNQGHLLLKTLVFASVRVRVRIDERAQKAISTTC
jgi:hypothetical protein